VKLNEIFQHLFELGNSHRQLTWKRSDNQTEYAVFSASEQNFVIYVTHLHSSSFVLPSILDDFKHLSILNVVFGVINDQQEVELSLTKTNKPFLPISIVKNAILDKAASIKSDIVVFSAKSEYDNVEDYKKRVGLYTTLVHAYAKQGKFSFKTYNDAKGTYYVLIKSSLSHQLSKEQHKAIQEQIVDKLTVKDKLKQLIGK